MTEGETAPAASDFIHWSEKIANAVAPGSSASELRGYCSSYRIVGDEVFDFENDTVTRLRLCEACGWSEEYEPNRSDRHHHRVSPPTASVLSPTDLQSALVVWRDWIDQAADDPRHELAFHAQLSDYN